MREKISQGDRVEMKDVYSSHKAHGLVEGQIYRVLFGNDREGISLDNVCPEGKYCRCQHKGSIYWTSDCFKLHVEITPEETERAKPLPSIQDTAAFFGMRVT